MGKARAALSPQKEGTRATMWEGAVAGRPRQVSSCLRPIAHHRAVSAGHTGHCALPCTVSSDRCLDSLPMEEPGA